MRSRLSVLIVVATSLLTSLVAWTAPSPALPDLLFTKAEQASLKEADEFLRRMGFEDYALQARKTLETERNLFEVSEIGLKKNVKRLESLNAARKLGQWLYASLVRQDRKDRLAFARKMDIAKAVLTQQLMPFPFLMLENPKDLDLEMKTPEEISDQKTEFYNKRAAKRYHIEKLNLIKAFMAIWPEPSKEAQMLQIQWLDHVLAESLDDAYSRPPKQQNRYLGKALILVYVKFLRERGLKELEKELADDLAGHGLFISNYISDRYAEVDHKYKLKTYDLNSGDLALEYSHGREAFFTSYVVQPQQKANQKLAEKLDLISPGSYAKHFMSDDLYDLAVEKTFMNQPLTEAEKTAIRMHWRPDLAKGFSHLGIVEVKSDPATALKTVWIWDIYPEDDQIGPVRLMTAHGFAHAERHNKIGFVKYNPRKLFQSFKKQIQKRGYLENIWWGYSSKVVKFTDGGRGPTLDNTQIYHWPTLVSKDQVYKWAQMDDSMAAQWWEEQVLPKVFDRIRAYAVSKDAKAFSAGLLNGRAMFYCSQMILVAVLEVANFDLQTEQDGLVPLLKFINEKVYTFKEFDTKVRFVSPNGLVWQADIFEDSFELAFGKSRPNMQSLLAGRSMADVYTEFLSATPEFQGIFVDPNLLREL